MKKDILNKKTIAYASACGGIEIKEIDFIDDVVKCVSGAWYGKKTPHRVKIHYETENPYFIIHGYRISFKDVMKY